MTLTNIQFSHLSALYMARAYHERDARTRREWQWKPVMSGPTINVRVLEALCRRKLARWIPLNGETAFCKGGYYAITYAGKKFLRDFWGD